MPRQYATLDTDGLVPASQLRHWYRLMTLALGPVAYWRLGESSGTTAADASGNGHDGTYVNAPTLGAAGLLAGDTNTAVSFDGVDDHVTAAGVSAVGSEWTMVAFVKRPSSGAGVVIHGPDNGVPYLRALNTGQATLVWRDSTATLRTLSYGGTDITADMPHHLVASHDGVTARFYLNGTQVASEGTWDSNAIPSGTWELGRFSAGSLQFLGVIDEPAVFSRALTASEVMQLYEAGT